MDRDSDRILRFLETMETNQVGPYIYEYQGYVFRKISGENFPQETSQAVYSVHRMTGGIKFIIVISLMLGAHLRVQYFHKNNVKQS